MKQIMMNRNEFQHIPLFDFYDNRFPKMDVNTIVLY